MNVCHRNTTIETDFAREATSDLHCAAQGGALRPERARSASKTRVRGVGSSGARTPFVDPRNTLGTGKGQGFFGPPNQRNPIEIRRLRPFNFENRGLRSEKVFLSVREDGCSAVQAMTGDCIAAAECEDSVRRSNRMALRSATRAGSN
jgi:hypothetical protein